MEDNLELVRRRPAEIWDPDHPATPEVLRRFLSPSFRRHTSAVAPPLDRETQIGRLQGIKTAFPDITITPDDGPGRQGGDAGHPTRYPPGRLPGVTFSPGG